MTDNLGHRIDELETHTVRMSNLTRFGSIKSTGNGSVTSTSSQYKSSKRNRREGSIFRNAWIQGAILCLVGIMTICLLAMAILYILEYQRNNDSEDNLTAIPPNVTSLHSFPSSPPTVVTTRPSIIVTTKKGLSSTLSTRLPPYRSVTTVTPTRPNKVVSHHSLEIGKPLDCGDGKGSCGSYCVSAPVSDLTSDSVLLDSNTISAPGSDTTSQTELPDHLNQILHSGSEEQEEEQEEEEEVVEEVQHDSTAVRREAEVEPGPPGPPPPGNADNELFSSRQKTVNFLAEQLGEEREKKLSQLAGRLPRNRNYAQTDTEGEDKVKPDQRLSLDVSEENEILDSVEEDERAESELEETEGITSTSTHPLTARTSEDKDSLDGEESEVQRRFRNIEEWNFSSVQTVDDKSVDEVGWFYCIISWSCVFIISCRIIRMV